MKAFKQIKMFGELITAPVMRCCDKYLRNVYSIAAVISLCGIYGDRLQAQVSEGGRPYSFSAKSLGTKIHTVSMPPTDVKALLLEDEQRIKDGIKPYRFGSAMDVDLGLDNAGTWETLADSSRLWRLRIISKDAISINLIYDRFGLPPGAKLFIYNEEKSMVLGAYTARNNKPYGKFATDLVKGEAIILEYFEPAGAKPKGRIHIAKVIHGYKNIFGLGKEFQIKGFGDSGACNNNVNCPEGLPWFEEINSVALILLNNNTELCSGALVNNVTEDLTQYFLTADHCLTGDEDTWIFRFNYQSPNCNNVNGPINQTVSGSTLLANNPNSDFALLELQEAIPEAYQVHYAGWYNQNVAPDQSVGIHHPSGDIKKISFDDDPAISSTFDGAPANSHWRILAWDDGTTEPGSSGSPLFNESHFIVGQLHGGGASCADQNESDWYGKLSMSWNNGNNAATRLRDWLDPDNTGIASIGQIASYDLTIDGTVFFSSTDPAANYFNTIGEIETEGSVTIAAPTEAVFRAKEQITLNPGFTAESGSEFHAYISSSGGGMLSTLLTKTFLSSEKTEPENTDEDSSSALAKETDNANAAKLPTEFGLSQNYPNPFNPETTIRYQLPQAGQVTLRIFNMLGAEVVTLHDGRVEAGYHRIIWNGKDKFGRGVASGLYLYRLEVRGDGGQRFVATRKMSLLR